LIGRNPLKSFNSMREKIFVDFRGFSQIFGGDRIAGRGRAAPGLTTPRRDQGSDAIRPESTRSKGPDAAGWGQGAPAERHFSTIEFFPGRRRH